MRIAGATGGRSRMKIAATTIPALIARIALNKRSLS
jgi:hypothetical protein